MALKKAPKTYTLKVRLSAHEQAKLEAHAFKHDLTLSKAIREYIRRLPCPPSIQEQRSQRKDANIHAEKVETIFNKISARKDSHWFKELEQPPELAMDDQEDELNFECQNPTEENLFSFWVEADLTLKDIPQDLDELILGLHCLHDGWDDSSVPGAVFKIYIAAQLPEAQEAIAQAQARGVNAGMYED